MRSADYPYGLWWTFLARVDDRQVRVHARTSLEGDVYDLQADDDYVGGTGDDALDEHIREHIRRVIALHDAFRVLDQARPALRGSTMRRVA